MSSLLTLLLLAIASSALGQDVGGCREQSDCAENEFCTAREVCRWVRVGHRWRYSCGVESGDCQARQTRDGECEANHECESGVCREGVCRQCGDDSQCGADEYCDTGPQAGRPPPPPPSMVPPSSPGSPDSSPASSPDSSPGRLRCRRRCGPGFRCRCSRRHGCRCQHRRPHWWFAADGENAVGPGEGSGEGSGMGPGPQEPTFTCRHKLAEGEKCHRVMGQCAEPNVCDGGVCAQAECSFDRESSQSEGCQESHVCHGFWSAMVENRCVQQTACLDSTQCPEDRPVCEEFRGFPGQNTAAEPNKHHRPRPIYRPLPSYCVECADSRPCQDEARYCNHGRCVSKQEEGTPCRLGDHCASGSCFEGHCTA